MRNFIKYTILSAAACLMAVSCYKDGTDYFDKNVRICLYPEPAEFRADGLTEAGDENYVGVVTVKEGSSTSDIEWSASGPDGCEWGTVRYTTLTTQYSNTLGTELHEVTNRAFEVVLQPNEGYRREYKVLVELSNGMDTVFVFKQLGAKADAYIECATKSIDIPSVGGETDNYVYTTNMDVCRYEITYNGEQKDWLKVNDKGVGKFSLTADPWTDDKNDRSASLTIIVGSSETSLAEITIPVTQIKFDTYYYMYGTSLGLDRSSSVAMTKAEKGIYTSSNFAFDAGTNFICFNVNTRSEAYPVYYLKNDGTVGESSTAVKTSDLELDANGIYNFTVNFNTMTYTMEPVQKCATAMPLTELANYPTKAYPTQNGSSKTWMTVSLHWNGGSKVGSMKLGSGLVAGHQTGGYGTPSDKTQPYDARVSAYDTEENGGLVSEVVDGSGTPICNYYGRLYSATEFFTGSPMGALNDRYQMDCPFGNPGDVYTDDAGMTLTLDNIIIANLSTYEASAAGDAKAEEEHPSLKLQVQGICPFGWHLANMQDWKDLIYAASVTSAGSEKEVAAGQANYKSMAGGTIKNFASMLYSKEWFEWSKTGKEGNRCSKAAEFGWNMFVQGWRLYATGYDYGPGDETPRFYAGIPCLGQYTDKKKAFWRIYVTSESTDMTCNDGFDIGNGCGTAYRCVKNYKSN